jgi:AraC-like DNA-binding protein
MLDISIFFIHRVLQYVKRSGVSPEALLERAGVALPGLGRFDLTVSEKKYSDIIAAALELTGDKQLGLHLGESTEWMDLSNLAYVMSNCRDLGASLDRAIGYMAFIGAPVELRMARMEDQSRLLCTSPQLSDSYKRHCVDEVVSTFYRIIKNITPPQFIPAEVCFAYPAPEDKGAYERIFACPVHFDRSLSALVFHPRQLLTNVIRPNPKLLFMARHGNGQSAGIPGERSYSKKIAVWLYDRLETGAPCIKHIAKELGISVRGLQMKLSEEGQTFSRIVRAVRRELAKAYLGDKKYSIDEITFLLGFSEPSVFHRAFKNWTGMTPGEYRNMSKAKPHDENVLPMTSTAG